MTRQVLATERPGLQHQSNVQNAYWVRVGAIFLILICYNLWSLDLTRYQSSLNKSFVALSSTRARLPTTVPSIAYTVAITDCDEINDPSNYILDAAAVLQHSIRQVSQQSEHYSNHDMIAICHDQDTSLSCRKSLEVLGYKIHVKPSPVVLSEIRNPEYAKIIQESGCCGEKEFLKLYGYNMTEYKVVVQLDLDMLLLRPLDDLFDAMLNGGTDYLSAALNISTTPRTTPIQSFFVRDFNANLKFNDKKNMAPYNKLQIQGAFLVLRPNPAALDELIELIKIGDFAPFQGWTKEGWGGVRKGQGGSDRFQGLLSYYYSGIHPNDAVDLHPCYHNVNGGPPIAKSGVCTTLQSTCEDCRKTNSSEIFSVHFGKCRKPWKCPFTDSPHEPWTGRGWACFRMHRAWHQVRYQWERYSSLLNTSQIVTNRRNPQNITESFFGHCRINPERTYGYEYLPIDKTPFLPSSAK